MFCQAKFLLGLGLYFMFELYFLLMKHMRRHVLEKKLSFRVEELKGRTNKIMFHVYWYILKIICINAQYMWGHNSAPGHKKCLLRNSMTLKPKLFR
jgi:hypothetical protein